MPDFTLYDYVAAPWFFLCWIGYTLYSDGPGVAQGNLTGVMKRRRLEWMTRMLGRENRIVDIQVVNSLLRNASFFASTSILILAGLITLLGATEKAIAFLTHIPFSVETSRQVWEFKILALIVSFVYAFFKFGWAMRQLNYCAIMIGAAGPAGEIGEADRTLAQNAAQIASQAALHSNRGIRAYYFGLALLVWFLHPLVLVPTAIFVVLVLYRREFRSHTLNFLDLGESA
ncbi:MAG: DUF599 domain-containing protein [Alphaproteobacteria bacterium]|nr:DUF599 domain-containing protein [Alphaproteobacteria bacterium]